MKSLNGKESRHNVIGFNQSELESGRSDEQLASDKESIQTGVATLNLPSDGFTRT